MSQYNPLLPVKREPTPPPALWQQAAPVVIRGAALVAAGVIGQWALRNAARKAISIPLARKSPRKPKPVATRQDPDSGIIAVSETVVMRRVIVRR